VWKLISLRLCGSGSVGFGGIDHDLVDDRVAQWSVCWAVAADDQRDAGLHGSHARAETNADFAIAHEVS
jgi:hypothetical protein